MTGETVQEIHVGVDEGAVYIGFAVTSCNKVLIKGEIELRHQSKVSKSIMEVKICN